MLYCAIGFVKPNHDIIIRAIGLPTQRVQGSILAWHHQHRLFFDRSNPLVALSQGFKACCQKQYATKEREFTFHISKTAVKRLKLERQLRIVAISLDFSDGLCTLKHQPKNHEKVKISVSLPLACLAISGSTNRKSEKSKQAFRPHLLTTTIFTGYHQGSSRSWYGDGDSFSATVLQ